MRGVASAFNDVHLCGVELLTDAGKLTRFGSWVSAAVNKKRRDCKFSESPIVEVLFWMIALFGNLQPRTPVVDNQFSKIIFAVISRQSRAYALAEHVRVVSHRLKKFARAGFHSIKMKRFEDDSRKPVGRRKPHHRCDHCSIAMAPQKCALDL